MAQTFVRILVHLIFSTNRRYLIGLRKVKRYIAQHKEHHRRRSFQDELTLFRGRHGVEYDERYIWTQPGGATPSGSVVLGASRLSGSVAPATLSAPFQGIGTDKSVPFPHHRKLETRRFRTDSEGGRHVEDEKLLKEARSFHP